MPQSTSMSTTMDVNAISSHPREQHGLSVKVGDERDEHDKADMDEMSMITLSSPAMNHLAAGAVVQDPNVTTTDSIELSLTSDTANMAMPVPASPSYSCQSLAMTLRGKMPASGTFVSMEELWVAFVSTLEKREPSDELYRTLRKMKAGASTIQRKASAQIMDDYEAWSNRSSGMAIDQHILTTEELARRYEVCLATGITDREAERIVKDLDERHEQHPNQHRVWGNIERLKKELPWLGPGALELLAKNVRVLRSGKLKPISASDIVPGDVVYLCGGNEVPADIRVLCCSNDATLDVSQMAHRSESRTITSEPSQEGDPFDATNLLFFGTVVTQGELFGIVYRLGRETMLRSVSTAVVDTTDFANAVSVPKAIADKAMRRLYENGLLLKSSYNLVTLGNVECVLLCLPAIILGMRQTQEAIQDMLKADLRVVIVLEQASQNDELGKRVESMRPHANFDIFDMERRLMKSSSKKLNEALFRINRNHAKAQVTQGAPTPEVSVNSIDFRDLSEPRAIQHIINLTNTEGLALCSERLDRPGASERLCRLIEGLKEVQEDDVVVMGVFSGKPAHIEAIKEANIGVVCRAFGQTTDGALRDCDAVTWRRKEDNDMRWILPVIDSCKELRDRVDGRFLKGCCTIL